MKPSTPKLLLLAIALSTHLHGAIYTYDFEDAGGSASWYTVNPRTGSGGQPVNAGQYTTADYNNGSNGGINYVYDGSGTNFGPSTSTATPTLPTGLATPTNIYFGGDNDGTGGATNPGQQAISIKLNSTWDLFAAGGKLSISAKFFNINSGPNTQGNQYNESYLWFGDHTSTVPILGDPINDLNGAGINVGAGSNSIWQNRGDATVGNSTILSSTGRPAGTLANWFHMRMNLFIADSSSGSTDSLWLITELDTGSGYVDWVSPTGKVAHELGVLSGDKFGPNNYLDINQIKLGLAVDGWVDGVEVRTGSDVINPSNISPIPETSSLIFGAVGCLLAFRRRRSH